MKAAELYGTDFVKWAQRNAELLLDHAGRGER
jgi:hypothetical protein